MKITIASFHYGESDSLSRSDMHTARNVKVCSDRLRGRIDAAYHRRRRESRYGKFGVAEWSHNKAVPGRPLQMQPADIEIYWKTWSIPAGREYMPWLSGDTTWFRRIEGSGVGSANERRGREEKEVGRTTRLSATRATS